MTVSANAASGSTLGAADSVYGIVQSVSTSSLPTGYTVALHSLWVTARGRP